MDDGTPVIEVNRGLQFLEVLESASGNVITSHELRVVDEDTSPVKLKYVVRSAPQCGRLEKVSDPGVEVLTFTQGVLDVWICLFLFCSFFLTTWLQHYLFLYRHECHHYVIPSFFCWLNKNNIIIVIVMSEISLVMMLNK